MILPLSQICSSQTLFKGFYDPAAGSPRTAMQEKLIREAKEAKEQAKKILPSPNDIIKEGKDSFEHILPDGSVVTISLDDLGKKTSQVLSDGGEVVNTAIDKIASTVAEHTQPALLTSLTHVLPDGATIVNVPLEHASNVSDVLPNIVNGHPMMPTGGESLMEHFMNGVDAKTSIIDKAGDVAEHILNTIG